MIAKERTMNVRVKAAPVNRKLDCLTLKADRWPPWRVWKSKGTDGKKILLSVIIKTFLWRKKKAICVGG